MSTAYIQAAPAEVLSGDAGIEALDALGTFADRLARRASSGIGADQGRARRPCPRTWTWPRATASSFTNHERAGRMQICYDGDAFRRVLAMRSSPEQRARAALALTRQECVDPDLRPLERNRLDEWRAEVLDRVDASALPGYLKNRVLMRRASVWSEPCVPARAQWARRAERAPPHRGASPELAGGRTRPN